MKRRNFLEHLAKVPLISVGAVFVNAVAESSYACEERIGSGIKSFGFYQGLGPKEVRSSSRPDGTSSGMPCINVEDVDEGIQKIYTFWHGHGGKKHQFVVTEENFLSLQQGQSIEIFTDVIQGHRHALKIEPNLNCQIS